MQPGLLHSCGVWEEECPGRDVKDQALGCTLLRDLLTCRSALDHVGASRDSSDRLSELR